MNINVGFLAVLIFALIMGEAVRHDMKVIREQQERINALIELNHDKSVYIDAGCRGRYEGAEELLPGEKGQQ